MVVTAGAIRRAKLQSNHHPKTNTIFFYFCSYNTAAAAVADIEQQRPPGVGLGWGRWGSFLSVPPQPHAGSGIVRIDPLRFPAGCSTRRLNHTLSYILACFIVLLFIRTPFYVLLVFRCYVFCLLVVLVELSVLAK